MIAPLGLMLALGLWTGPDLPTGAPDTIKYKLTVNGEAGHDVKLRAGALPKDWIATFCTQRICAPFKTTLTLPASGTAVLEFQLVPPGDKAKRPVPAQVFADDGTDRVSARTPKAATLH
jgi:hypothetical protein